MLVGVKGTGTAAFSLLGIPPAGAVKGLELSKQSLPTALEKNILPLAVA